MENQLKLQKLEADLKALTEEYYKNNFSNFQQFTKYSSFTNRLKVPSYTTLPSTCEVGEIAESAGKLQICSATNTWTIVGTQT